MKNTIDKFIELKKVGIVGVSRDSQKWGNMLFRTLKKRDYTVYPVNPNTEEIMGAKCYPSVKLLPAEVENIIITVPSNITEQVVTEIPGTHIKRVWMHRGGGQGSQSEKAIEYCRNNGVEVVYDLCPLMFIPPAGIHKLHFLFKKLFGKLPQEFYT
ncbi:MAG: CoA-binding protein [Spirochaetota bacterium]